MAQLTKMQAVGYIATALADQKLEGESDVEFVLRIRSAQRVRHDTRRAKGYANVDRNLKDIALKQYYVENPDTEETVQDLD